jgi:hypothetical protein
MQGAVNTTMEEEVFSMVFACIHFWATDVFSMDPLRDYTSSTGKNQIRKKERTRMVFVLCSQGRRAQLRIVSYCN